MCVEGFYRRKDLLSTPEYCILPKLHVMYVVKPIKMLNLGGIYKNRVVVSLPL